jgi:peptidoglycan hydrolase-like protein with peptidoglycan-binding domain
LLAPAGRGAARLLVEWVTVAPTRVYVGAALAALLAGVGGSALLLQIGRHPAPPLVEATRGPVATAEPVAPHTPPAPVVLLAAPAADIPDTAPPLAPPAAARARATQASAPDTTSSLGPAQGPDRAATHAADPIGALLRGKPVDDGSHLVRAAQVALVKLGYPVKPDGVEDGATRRALRRFQRAHGLSLTTEISAELVKQLIAAARTKG